MAVKVCAGEACMICTGSLREVRVTLEQGEKAGEKYFCCGLKCVRIDKITTLEELPREEEEPDDDRDDEDDRRGALDLSHPDVVIVTGGYSSPRRSRATPAEPAGEPWLLGQTSERERG